MHQVRRSSRRGVPLAFAAALLVWVAVPLEAQQGTVSGVVVSGPTLAPLAGAQVTVAGSTRGTVTSANGRFEISGLTAPRITLRVSRTGYGTETRTVSVPSTNLQIQLAEAAVALDELVVTGTPGAREKREIGNVVSTINAEQVVAIAPVGNLQELVNGRVAGAVILQSTGMVGSGSRIRIRGASSFSLQNQPLLYVDGVRVNNDQATGPTNQGFGSSVISRFNDINPEDIQSIEILKGPAAATLYGTEASNGVIQVITKKGRAGAPRFNLKVTQGANWFSNPEDRLWTNYDVVDGEVQSINFEQLQDAWGENIFRTGHVQEYDVNVRGGTEQISYYAAGGFKRNEGAEIENQDLKYSTRANLTVRPNENWDATLNLGYIAGRTDLVWEAGAGGVTWSTYFATPRKLDSPRRGFWSGTPESYHRLVDTWQDLNRFTGSVQLNHRPADWFAHRLTIGTDQTREQNVELFNRLDQFAFFDSFAKRGYKEVLDRNVQVTTLDYSGTFNFAPTEAITSSTSLGAQYFGNFREFTYAYGEDFPVPGLKTVAATAVRTGSDDYTENTTVGVFAQQQFGWRDRLFLTAGLRADDNSAFGQEFDLVYYPKVSGSWVITEEPFWNLGFVNSLRVRAAYGQAGQQPEVFAALRTFAPVPGPGDVGVVTPQAVGNPFLGPERAEEIELGFDASVFNDRIGLEFTYYDQNKEDAILLRQIAPSTGFAGQQYVNAGAVSNSGYEVLLNADLYRSANFAWDATFTVANNNNEVLSLGDVTDADFIQASRYIQHRVGYPIGSWFAEKVVSAELTADGRAINAMCEAGIGNPTIVPCDDAEPVFLGRTSPDLEGAFRTSVSLFNNLRFYGMVDYKRGYAKLDGNERVRCFFFELCRANHFPQEFDPALVAGYQEGIVSVLIHDASFAKLRELSASYTLPRQWSGRIGAERMQVTVAGRNLATWTKYPGLEPEAAFHGGGRGGDFALWEQSVLPQLRQFVVSVDLGF